ncbi:unnamed protein product [Linum trigynum]|uniref:Uncharacterized protein n=1 Tax=Linum trigynum TaxID=586398 RepID=A0AAV2FR40_9ROSI
MARQQFLPSSSASLDDLLYPDLVPNQLSLSGSALFPVPGPTITTAPGAGLCHPSGSVTTRNEVYIRDSSQRPGSLSILVPDSRASPSSWHLGRLLRPRPDISPGHRLTSSILLPHYCPALGAGPSPLVRCPVSGPAISPTLGCGSSLLLWFPAPGLDIAPKSQRLGPKLPFTPGTRLRTTVPGARHPNPQRLPLIDLWLPLPLYMCHALSSINLYVARVIPLGKNMVDMCTTMWRAHVGIDDTCLVTCPSFISDTDTRPPVVPQVGTI